MRKRRFWQTATATPANQIEYPGWKKPAACSARRKRSVVKISLDVGYANPSHFAQLFRRDTGVAPSNFRRQQKFPYPYRMGVAAGHRK